MAEIWDNITLFNPQDKAVISIRLDKDILSFFRGDGTGYQKRINAVLKSFVAYQRRKENGGYISFVHEITGGNSISGEVKIGGSVLASTYIMCASLMTKEEVNLINIPNVKSLFSLTNLFKSLLVQNEIFSI